MNPLTSILGTIISGFVLSIIIVLGLGTTALNGWGLDRPALLLQLRTGPRRR
jgi:hypothetical protein